MEYVGIVERGGHLSLPETIKDQMCLKPDQVLRVTIVTNDCVEQIGSSAMECWRSMGRDAKPGCIKDASTKHDEYLYGRRL